MPDLDTRELVELATKPLRDDIAELRATLARYLDLLSARDERVAALETGSAVQEQALKVVCKLLESLSEKMDEMILFTLRAEGLEKRVAGVDRRLEAVEAVIPAIKALKWLLGLFGTTLLLIIWAIVTGQVKLVVP